MVAKGAIDKAFGMVLRRLREEKTKQSHLSFSSTLGINRSHYGRIERGEASPRLGMIETLAHGLNMEVSEVMILVDKERKRIISGSVVKAK